MTPRCLSAAEMRGIERRAPGIADDVDLLRRLAAGRDRPHDVGEVGRVDVLVHHHDDAPHVAVGGGDQRGALGMAVIALLERDHRHQLRDVLPDADHVGDAGGFEILPDAWRRGTAARNESAAASSAASRAGSGRCDDGCRHLHHRRRPRFRGVIAGEFAERSFRQRVSLIGRRSPSSTISACAGIGSPVSGPG